MHNYLKEPKRESLSWVCHSFNRLEYPNHTVLLHHQVSQRKQAIFTVCFYAGTRFEKSDKWGVTHLLEHLVFKRGREGNTHTIKEIESLGGEINAYTSQEELAFELNCSVKKVEILIPLFMKLLTSLEFTDDELVNEKKVVIQEILDDENQDEVFLSERSFELLYPEDLGHPIGGTRESVQALQREDIENCFLEQVETNPPIFTFVGDCELEILQKLLEDSLKGTHFSQKKEKRRAPCFEENRVSLPKVSKTFERDCEIENCLLYVPAVPYHGEGGLVYDFLAYYLTAGLNCPLFEELRNKLGLVYHVEASTQSFSDMGHFIFEFSCGLNDSSLAVEALEKVLLQLNFSDLEMKKELYLESWEMSFDDIDERCEFLTQGEMYSETIYTYQDMQEALADVTQEEVKKIRDHLLLHLKHRFFLIGGTSETKEEGLSN